MGDRMLRLKPEWGLQDFKGGNGVCVHTELIKMKGRGFIYYFNKGRKT